MKPNINDLEEKKNHMWTNAASAFYRNPFSIYQLPLSFIHATETNAIAEPTVPPIIAEGLFRDIDGEVVP